MLYRIIVFYQRLAGCVPPSTTPEFSQSIAFGRQDDKIQISEAAREWLKRGDDSAWRKYDCRSITIKQASLIWLSTQITRESRKDPVEKGDLNEYGVLNLSTR